MDRLTLEQRLKAAVWAAGNVDMEEDHDQWWRVFQGVWAEVAVDREAVQGYADIMKRAAVQRGAGLGSSL